MKEPIQLSDHFTYGRLLRFTAPSMAMMVFTSIYGIVDGLFVSNFAGKTPFAALNLIFPFIMILGTFGFMVGTGGSAIVAKTFGEGSPDRANRYFSMLVRVTVEVGLVLSVVGIVAVEPVARAFGAEGEMLEGCVVYGRTLLVGLVAFMLQNVFQSFLVTAEKPRLALRFSVAAGVTNMALDALFLGVFRWGLVGAAAATVASEVVGGIFPLVYFIRPNSSILHLSWAKHEARIILKTCVNGSSELMSNIAASVVGMLFNLQLMRLIGEDGVAAYGVIMYVIFIFAAVFIGYAIGSAPIVSYHYGARNTDELKSLLRKSLALIACFAVVMEVSGQLLAGPWAQIFVGYDPQLKALTEYAFHIYALSFLLCGFNIWASSFFTALNNGLVSAIISFLRTLLFEAGSVIVLPMIFGVDGIWFAIIVAEIAALVVSTSFLLGMRGKYGYL